MNDEQTSRWRTTGEAVAMCVVAMLLEVAGCAMLASRTVTAPLSAQTAAALLWGGAVVLSASATGRRAWRGAVVFVASMVLAVAVLVQARIFGIDAWPMLLAGMFVGGLASAALSALPVRPLLLALGGLALASAPILSAGEVRDVEATAAHEVTRRYAAPLADLYEAVLDAEAAAAPTVTVSGPAVVRKGYADFWVRRATGPASVAAGFLSDILVLGAPSEQRVVEIFHETQQERDSVAVTTHVTVEGSARTWIEGGTHLDEFAAEVARSRAAAVDRAIFLRLMGSPMLTADMRRLRDTLSRLARVSQASGFTGVAGAVSGNQSLRLTSGASASTVQRRMMAAATDARSLAWLKRPEGNGGQAQFRFEDVYGRCVMLTEHSGGTTSYVACAPTFLAERARRSTVLFQRTLQIGQHGMHWSVNAWLAGSVRVYRDSVALRIDSLVLEGNDTEANRWSVDSVVLGLAGTDVDGSWSMRLESRAVAGAQSVPYGGRRTRRFLNASVPLSTPTSLHGLWPMLEVSLSGPRTVENPYGRAWTYAHAPMTTLEQAEKP